MAPKQYERHEPCKLKLFTPGPVIVPDYLLKELALPNDTHRNAWYSELQESVEVQAKRLMYTETDVLTFVSSGTGAMEACMSNLLNGDEHGLVLSCGAFGNRWYQIGQGLGKNVDKYKIPDGTAFRADKVKEWLEKKDYRIVCIEANETSAGVMNKLEEIAPVVKNAGALLCVDAVSALGGLKVDVDKLKIDVCLGSTQKALALPAGLALAAVSDEAFEKAERTKNRGYYFDMVELRKKVLAKHQTPTTGPIHTLRALDISLNHILEIEGLDNCFARHRRMADVVKEWANGRGLEMVPEPGYESPTVSAIRRPEGMVTLEFVKQMIGRGYRIVNGYGDLKDKSFRIGHMGALMPDDIKELLEVMDDVLGQ
jgi:aspartate aminotransferase-like enzyme